MRDDCDPKHATSDAENRSTAGARRLLHDFWRLLTPYWTSSRKRTAWGLVLLLVFLDLFSIFMAKKLNDWHGQFFAALQAVDQTRFVSLLLRWAVIMSIMVVAAAYKTYVN